jgi:ribonuclease PH
MGFIHSLFRRFNSLFGRLGNLPWDLCIINYLEAPMGVAARSQPGFCQFFPVDQGSAILSRLRFDNPTVETFMRPSGRAPDAMRTIALDSGFAKYAEGSCLAKFGDTQVLCTASVEERVPPFLRNTGKGWVTAEYGMLPRSTATRTDREATRGRQSGRTQEIQRLIGRSLRAVIDLTRLGERQIRIDCDVLQADGGTRTAAVTGSYVALHQACQRLVSTGLLTGLPLRDSVAAVSCGVVAGSAVLDLDYAEDSQAETDANFVLTGTGGIVEIQATAEGAPFDEALFAEMLRLARAGISELTRYQRAALGLG